MSQNLLQTISEESPITIPIKTATKIPNWSHFLLRSLASPAQSLRTKSSRLTSSEKARTIHAASNSRLETVSVLVCFTIVCLFLSPQQQHTRMQTWSNHTTVATIAKTQTQTIAKIEAKIDRDLRKPEIDIDSQRLTEIDKNFSKNFQ